MLCGNCSACAFIIRRTPFSPRRLRPTAAGMLNLTRPRELPQDDGSCTLLGLMCSFSAEVNSNVFIAQRG